MSINQQQVAVLLQFRAMSLPISVTVPASALCFLDTHAQRTFSSDGTPVYRLLHSAMGADEQVHFRKGSAECSHR